MPVAVTDLLRFILQLLGDPAKAEAFGDDPSGALAAAGLGNVTCGEVDAITPLVANSAPGVVPIAYVGGGGGSGGAPFAQPEPAEMIRQLVKNVAVSNFDNSGVIQNIWGADEVTQAFATDGGLALGGDLIADKPVVLGDGNVVASDTAQASGRDTIQNQADGNLALGGDQTIAQDDGVITGGDNIAAGDKIGGNNNAAENTGNDNSVSVGGNQYNAEHTGNDNSVSVGGSQNNAENTGNDSSVSVGGSQNNAENTGNDNSVSVGGSQNSAENTGNTTVHDESFNVGDVDFSDNSDNSTTVGGNQNNAENTGNSTVHDESISVGDVDLSYNPSVGGDYWEGGSNVGGIGNTDNRNSGNISDSGNTLAITETHDDSINVGTVAIDLSQQNDHSVTTGDIIDDHSLNVGDISLSNYEDNSSTVGDTDNSTHDDNSSTSGDVDNSIHDDHSSTTGNVDNSTHDDHSVGDITAIDDHSTSAGDTTYVDDHSTTAGDSTYVDDHSVTTGDTVDYDYTYDDHSVGGNHYESDSGSSYGGDYYEQGSGNTTVVDETHVNDVNDFDFTWGE